MNYKGKNGKLYEVAYTYEKMLFGKDGEILVQCLPGGLTYELQRDYNFATILQQFAEEYDRNVGGASLMKITNASDTSILFQVADPLANFFDRMDIPKREAAFLYSGEYRRHVSSVKDFLETHYDDDTEVNIYCANEEFCFTATAQLICIHIPDVFNRDIQKYYDDCYHTKSVSIWPKGLRNTGEVFDQVYEMREALLYSMNKRDGQ